jgi:3-hydroxybutyryl-CoA dehydratase
MLGKTIDQMKVGDSAEFCQDHRRVGCLPFAGITGDLNPFHVNEDFSKDTFFKGRIAHGILLAGFISTVIGCHCPALVPSMSNRS